MKLVYISHWQIPSDKTMSPLVMKTCEEFAKQGFDVELLVPWRSMRIRENPFKYHGVEENFDIRRLPALDLLFPLGRLGFWILLLTFNISLVFNSIFRSSKTIFYAHDWRDVFLLTFVANNIFLEIHDFYLSKFKIFDKHVLQRSKGIISTNQIKINNLNKLFKIPKTKMLHKPNAVNVEMFNIKSSKSKARKIVHFSQDKKIVVYTGHLFDWKGVDTLLEAHKYLIDFDIYFVGGTGKDIDDMKCKANEMDAQNVFFIGQKPHQNIPYYLKSADVLVLPNTAKIDASKYETSPVKLFEYMASGIPIVASRIPSIQNIVDENSVTFFEADNAESLAESIKKVVNSPEEFRSKTEFAFKEVQQYTWKKRIGDITKFIYDHTN